MMKLHSIGMDFTHDKDFEIDRPNGSGDDLLLIFKTPAVVETKDAQINVFPDSALLYRVGEPQHYKACADSFTNHWIHMDCGESDKLHEQTGMPFGEVVKLTNSAEAEDIMRMLVREELSSLPSKEACIDLLIRMLLIKLGDNSRAQIPREAQSPYYSALMEIRTEIYSNPGRFYCIEQLAASANLSPSYFQRLYSRQFSVSCYEDMLTARIRTAKRYLKDTGMSVREIALGCGYENDVVFMRRFKQRTGLTPSEYRRKFG